MPQIAQLSETFASQIFWALVFFGIVFFVIGKGMVPKVMETVALREKQIADDLAAAENARRAAQDVESHWQADAARQRAEAHALIGKAKSDAALASEKRLAAAAEVVDARLAQAETRIAAARQGALAEIETLASDAAGAIVARLAGMTVEPGLASAAVKEVLHG